MSRIGERVGAIQSADAMTVELFGYGTYEGDHVPPEDVEGPFGRLGLFGAKNPMIRLDDGTVVWGCESWWGPEEKIRAAIKGREVVIVKPTRTPPTDDERAQVAAMMAAAKKEVDEMFAKDAEVAG